jgi:hypothetical protein
MECLRCWVTSDQVEQRIQQMGADPICFQMIFQAGRVSSVASRL